VKRKCNRSIEQGEPKQPVKPAIYPQAAGAVWSPTAANGAQTTADTASSYQS